MGSLAGVKTMNLAMEDKIKEGYYALCLAILKGYSVSEAFHALEMPNWKERSFKNRHLGDGTGTECDRNCKRVWMLRLNRKALQADEIGTAEFVGCFWK